MEFVREHAPATPAAPSRAAPPPAWSPPTPARGRAADLASDHAQQRAKAPAAGTRLDPALASRFGAAFGRDFSGVTVVRDSTDAATQGARAFARGQQLDFAPGEYQPGTPAGDHLVAHELAHVVQQSDGTPGIQHAGGTGPHEAEADKAAAVATAGGTVGALTPATPGAVQKAPKARNVAPVAPGEVDLSSGSFSPDEPTATAITDAGARGALVTVKVPGLAEGQVKVRKDTRGTYHFVGADKKIPVTGGPLASLASLKAQLVLALGKDNVVTGFAAPEGSTSGSALAQLLRGKEGPASFGWAAVSHVKGLDVQNTFANGTLSIGATGFSARFGNLIDGTASFAIDNTKYSFDGSLTFGTERFKGFTPGAHFDVHRSAEGKYTGSGKLGVDLGGITTSATVTYNDGEVGLIGTVGVRKGVFAGSVTLIWADPATVRQAVAKSIPAANLKTPPAAAAGKEPGPRQLAGIGNVSANISEWLAGEVTVIVDGAGHVTVVGEFAPPAEIVLFPQKDYVKELFKVEARAKYGVPVLGNVFVFANASLAAVAKLGPLKIYKIKASGVFSTDSTIAKSFTLEASLNLSAFAGLRLRLEGGVGLEILGHDIKAGVGVQALAGIEGYVEATPKIGVREKATGGPEFFLDGHAELGARPVLVLSGDLFVELDSPWWSPAPDKKWTWPLGSLEYPLGGEFGIAADVAYVFGSKQLPEVKFGEVDFDASKFTTDLMEDKAGGGGGKKGKKSGQWGEGKGGDPKGKGKGKGGGGDEYAEVKPEERFYGPIGATERFSGGGEGHRQWIEDRGENATLMVASANPGPVEAKLQMWEGMLDLLEAGDQGKAKGLIGQARGEVGGIDRKADQLAALKQATMTGRGKPKPSKGKRGGGKPKKQKPQAVNQQVKAAQKKLARTLGKLFTLFEEVPFKTIKRPAAMSRGKEQVTAEASGSSVALKVGGQPPQAQFTAMTPLANASNQRGQAAATTASTALVPIEEVMTSTRLRGRKILKRRYRRLEKEVRKAAVVVGTFGRKLRIPNLARATRIQPMAKPAIARFTVPRFPTAPTYDSTFGPEFKRQVANQLVGMGKATVDQWAFNINLFSMRPEHFVQLDNQARSKVGRILQERARRSLLWWRRELPRREKLLQEAGRLRANVDALSAESLAAVATQLGVQVEAAQFTDRPVAKSILRHVEKMKKIRFRKSERAIAGNTQAVETAGDIASGRELTEAEVKVYRGHLKNPDEGVSARGRHDAGTGSRLRREYRSYVEDLVAELSAKGGRWEQLAKTFGDIAILHNPDQVAGGEGVFHEPPPIPGPTATIEEWETFRAALEVLFGPQVVNGEIGRQWARESKNAYDRVTKQVVQEAWGLWYVRLRPVYRDKVRKAPKGKK